MNHSRSAFIVIATLLLLIGPSAFAAPTFTHNPGSLTGLEALMNAWATVETTLQGGTLRSWWPWAVRTFDYDRDGDQDVVVTQHEAAGSKIFQNQFVQNGTVTFQDVTDSLGVTARQLPQENSPTFFPFGGPTDQYSDIGSKGEATGHKKNAFNINGTSFQVQSTGNFTPVTRRLFIQDLNFDTYLDAWGVANSYGKTTFYQYINNKNNTFTGSSKALPRPVDLPASIVQELDTLEATAPSSGDYLRYVGPFYWTGDLNNDGFEDMVIQITGSYTGYARGRYLIRNPQTKQLEDKTATIGIPGGTAPILPPRDFTGDGLPDLFTGRGTSTEAGFYRQNSDGTFTNMGGDPQAFLRIYGPYFFYLIPSDLDADGDIDVILQNPRIGSVNVLENQGAGKFVKILSVGAWDAQGIHIADFNNDGYPDIINGTGQQSTAKNVGIYMNNGSANPAPASLVIDSPKHNGNYSGRGLTISYKVVGRQSGFHHLVFKMDNGVELWDLSPQLTPDMSGTYNFGTLASGAHTLTAYAAKEDGSEISGTRSTTSFTMENLGDAPEPTPEATPTPEPTNTNPTITIEPATYDVRLGETLNITIKANDQDGDIVSITIPDLDQILPGATLGE